MSGMLYQVVVTTWNVGVFLTLPFGLLILLRPVTNRLMSPQQRVCLWGVGWLACNVITPLGIYSGLRVLPVTLRDLAVSRTGGRWQVPAFLPPEYRTPGTYNLALPGGRAIPVELDGRLTALLLALWIAGIVLLTIWGSRREKVLTKLSREGNVLERGSLGVDWPEKVAVRLCRGLPTSYVRSAFGEEAQDGFRYVICLQAELPRDRLELVLRHELAHIRLKHSWIKTYLSYGILMCWWNPMIWLSYRLTCRDMELACDQQVLSKLDQSGRREYAKVLVDLGSGRHMWDAPLSFGECDAAVRVRRAVAWRPGCLWAKALTWGLTALLTLFLFTGGPNQLRLEDDLITAWQREIAAEDFWDRAWRGEEKPDLPLEEAWWNTGRMTLGESGFDGATLYARDRAGVWRTWEWVWAERYQEFWPVDYRVSPVGEVPDLTGCSPMPVP